MLLTYLAGTSIATFVPVMSLFLTNDVAASPIQVGVYFTISAIVGIIVSQVLAIFSDKNISRNNLVFLAGVSGLCAALVLIYLPYYYCILTFGVIFLSISSVCSPQIFASGREYGIAKYGNSIMFTSYMRSFFALAWVIAPPIAYVIADLYGFKVLFFATAFIFTLLAIIGKIYMPDTKNLLNSKFKDNLPKSEESLANEDLKDNSNAQLEGDKNLDNAKSNKKFNIIGNKDVMLLFLAVTLLWTCNNLYLISMPIYITKELQIGSSLPGFMMATAAFLEIPIMLLGGMLCKKIGIKPLMIISALSGFLFYMCYLCLPLSYYAFFVIQVFNALFIGILACLGMVYFQELLPHIPGQATTLSNNSVNTGAIASGGLIALVVAEGSYSNAFVTGAILALLAFIILFFVRKV